MTPDEIQKVFPEITPELAAILSLQGQRKTVPKGTILYEEGNPCLVVPFIISGSARVFKLSENGREITLFRVGPGQTCILSTSCGISGAKYQAVAEAEEDLDMLALPATVFRTAIQQHPTIQMFLCSLLAERLANMMTVVEEVAFRRVDLRLAERLLKESAQSLVLDTTHAQLAVELGTAREVVSRILKDFEKGGYVSLGRGRIEVTSRPGLEKYRHQVADTGPTV